MRQVGGRCVPLRVFVPLRDMSVTSGELGGVRRPPRRSGPGSVRVLTWVGRLGLVGLEPLRLGLPMSASTLRSHLVRLDREGLVIRARPSIGGPATVTATARGQLLAQAHGADGVVERRGEPPVEFGVAHGCGVSWVAASAETRGWRWLGPAQLRLDDQPWDSRTAEGRRHLPDLGLLLGDGRRIAVEVELARKTKARTRAILGGYRRRIGEGAIDAVSYITASGQLARFMREQAAQASMQERVEVGELATLIDHVRRARGAR